MIRLARTRIAETVFRTIFRARMRAVARTVAQSARTRYAFRSNLDTSSAFAVVFVLFVAVSVLAGTQAARADVVLETRYPVAGTPCEVLVQDDANLPRPGATVSVTYRPGSSVERPSRVGTTDDSGRVVWTPELAGIATVTASWAGGSTRANVSVQFSHPPLSGLLIMVFAGIVLVGGSAVRIRRVLRSPPDTGNNEE